MYIYIYIHTRDGTTWWFLDMAFWTEIALQQNMAASLAGWTCARYIATSAWIMSTLSRHATVWTLHLLGVSTTSGGIMTSLITTYCNHVIKLFFSRLYASTLFQHSWWLPKDRWADRRCGRYRAAWGRKSISSQCRERSHVAWWWMDRAAVSSWFTSSM